MLCDQDAALQNWMLALVLYEDPAGILRVWSIELVFNDIKHRLNFSSRNRMVDVFNPGVAREFHAVLDKMGDTTHLFADPDYELKAEGVILAGLRAMRWTDDKRGRQVIMRFKFFVGPIDRLLRARVPFTRSVFDHKERIAVEALSDITAPLLGLASIPANLEITQSQRDTIEAKLAVISERASDLQFYISLLTRYVRECAEELPRPEHNPVMDQKPVPQALKG